MFEANAVISPKSCADKTKRVLRNVKHWDGEKNVCTAVWSWISCSTRRALLYVWVFFFKLRCFTLTSFKKNNVLYVAIYCLCDWNVVFYSFSRPTFNGGLPIVAQLALVKGAAAFLFCFVCFVFFRHEAQRFRLLVINSGWPKEYSHFTHCSNPFL